MSNMIKLMNKIKYYIYVTFCTNSIVRYKSDN